MIRQAREEMNPMKKAVKAIRRFPFCFVRVKVEPKTGPRDQLTQVPM